MALVDLKFIRAALPNFNGRYHFLIVYLGCRNLALLVSEQCHSVKTVTGQKDLAPAQGALLTMIF